MIRAAAATLARAKRRLYAGGRPSPAARVLNTLIARQHALGILATRASATLVVTGRRTGRPILLPVVLVAIGGGHYVVSMLGERSSWVHNLRATGGRAVLLHHRRRETVLLLEVPAEERAPILRRYLDVAPGARPHLPVSRRAPLTAFAHVADAYPVFRVQPAPGSPGRGAAP